ncbi:MAG: hypothetical protein IKI06_09850 [Prevotella sp.]|nr:hypothetical protein [Prevotella sp.]
MEDITEKNLLKCGFEKRKYGEVAFYVKDQFAIVQQFKWLPCNIETGEPLNTCIYVNTMEELEKLMGMEK